MILGLRTAIYPVTDLDEAKTWYARALGVPPYFDQPFYAGFSVGGFELGLVPEGTPSVDGPQPLWGVSDIGAEVDKLIGLGATALDPVTDSARELGSPRFGIRLAIDWA